MKYINEAKRKKIFAEFSSMLKSFISYVTSSHCCIEGNAF